VVGVEHDPTFNNIEAAHVHIGSAITGFQNGHEAMGFRLQGREMQRDDILGDFRQAGLILATHSQTAP
jgi:hypothetical protein